MGYEFDENGKYVGWSDIFDYSGIEELKASEYLPIPTGVKYVYKTQEDINSEIEQLTNDLNNLKEDEVENREKLIQKINSLKKIRIIDISEQMLTISNKIKEIDNIWKQINTIEDPEQLKLLNKRFHTLKAQKIKLMAFLLRNLSEQNYTSIKGKKYTYLLYDSNIENSEDILNEINKHSSTIISPEKLEKCLKNAVSSSITNIIQNLRNMDQAYSPIEMKDFRDASENSTKGSRSDRMTLLNPLTKFVMQEQNMVGKGVIGITAVGEKVFFNLSYYWNEGIRSKNEKWLRNLQFSQHFDRIQGRSGGILESVTKTTLANVNFESDEEMRLKFIEIADFDTYLRNSLYITDQDIKEKNAKWHAYHGELLKYARSKQYSDVYADDLISQLLSAATDNAKELILAKINAGTNLARCYLHLIMMGFDVNDIVSFMTSNAVSLVNDLMQVNMFDEFMFNTNVNEIIDILQGNFPITKFFYETIDIRKSDDDFEDEYDERESDSKSSSKDAQNLVRSRLQKALQDAGVVSTKKVKKDGETITILVPKDYKDLSFSEMIRDFYKCKIEGKINESLIDFTTLRSKTKLMNSLMAFSDYIDNISEKVKVNIKTSEDLDEFYKDLEEFEKVYDLATETSTLGSTFLGLNQGIPTDKKSLLNKVINIQKIISDRQKKFGISGKKLRKALANPKDDKSINYLSNVLDKIKANNEFIEGNTILPILQNALNLGIIDDFNFFSWLENKNNYRDITSDYYNLIKGTWNIFDIIEKLPHFEAIFQCFKSVLTFDKALIKKSHVLNIISKNLFGTKTLDSTTTDKLIDYIDDLLILRQINKQQLKFPIFDNDPLFLFNWKEIKQDGDSFIILDSETNRGTFKKLFEEVLFPQLKEGKYIRENGKEEIITNNKFISNLDIDINSSGQKYLKLGLDMQNISGTSENDSLYQECLTDFIKLKNYYYGDKTLADWFMLYNLLINKNLFGSDRLTSLFGSFINQIKETNYEDEFLQKVGDFDFSDLSDMPDDILLKELGFNRDDALLKVAPIINESQEISCKSEIIKETINRIPVIKRKINSYGKTSQYGNPESIIPNSSDNNFSVNDSKVDQLIRLRNYISYGVISTPFANKNSSNINNLRSKNVDLVLNALRNYMKQGDIIFYTENC